MNRFNALSLVSSAWVTLLFAGAGCSSSLTNYHDPAPPAVYQSPSSPAKVELFSSQASSDKITDGSLLLMKLTHPSASKVVWKGVFDDKEFPFFKVDDTSSEAVLGIPIRHAAGPTKLAIVSSKGERLEVPITIIDGGYKKESLTVDQGKVSPPKKALKRILAEQAEIGKIYEVITPKKSWEGPFHLPIDSEVTSTYGNQRLFNGQLLSFHTGLDLRAPMGTPIHAAAPGVVVLAKELWFTGNTVMIDHGYGIITLYAHMSKLNVKKGDKIVDDQILGLSGATGRATGPHLHWTAVVQKVKVNPMDLTRVLR